MSFVIWASHVLWPIFSYYVSFYAKHNKMRLHRNGVVLLW